MINNTGYIPNYNNIINNLKYKECPKCKALMLKEEGTNKIMCVCGIPFCYRCGKSIREKHNCK